MMKVVWPFPPVPTWSETLECLRFRIHVEHRIAVQFISRLSEARAEIDKLSNEIDWTVAKGENVRIRWIREIREDQEREKEHSNCNALLREQVRVLREEIQRKRWGTCPRYEDLVGGASPPTYDEALFDSLLARECPSLLPVQICSHSQGPNPTS